MREFKKIYKGFEDFYDFYRDSTEILEPWNEQFKDLDSEFENDVMFYFQVIEVGRKDRITELENDLSIAVEALFFYANGDSHYDVKYEWDVLNHHRETGSATKPSGDFALKALNKIIRK